MAASRNKCPYGHELEAKVVSGGILGIGLKQCSNCKRELHSSTLRHSCKGCRFHLCDPCWTAHISAADAGSSAPFDARRRATTPMGPLAHVVEAGVAAFGRARSATDGATSSGVPEAPLCKFGAGCYNHDPEHRRRFAHPDDDGSAGGRLTRRACRFGAGCYQRSPEHLARFAHPGDRHYRIGLVIFEKNSQPQFETLWQLFQFHDPDESGHMSFEEFQEALSSCAILAPGKLPERAEDAWNSAGGPLHGYLNFRQFVSWTQTDLGLEFPIGLEVSGSSRPCRFRMGSLGDRCSCPGYEPAARGTLCVCGHKESMHRSEHAERSLTKFLEDVEVNPLWGGDEEGLVEVDDPEILARIQAVLDSTHKTTDNWTRDRGCKTHGVNGCPWACAARNRVEVPKGYTLVGAYRNQNRDLWQKYTLLKNAIARECTLDGEVPYTPIAGTVEPPFPLDAGCNEWYLFHGTSPEKCRTICATNFRLNMAGTGATWKDTGVSVGTPLYGFGVYFAEKITKADEYSAPIPPGEVGEGCHCAVLCRVIGGRTNIVTTNEIEVDKLRRDVFDGPYHSVFGDRVSSLGKPFREVVVYDKDQCFPELLLVYTRNYS